MDIMDLAFRALKGGYIGGYVGEYFSGLLEDTRSLVYCSYERYFKLLSISELPQFWLLLLAPLQLA